MSQITVQMHTEQTLFGTTVNDARSFFNALDHDRTGTLDRDELKQGLKRLGVAVPSYLLDPLLVKMDTNRNGLIELKEVLQTFRVSSEPSQPSQPSQPLDEQKVKELRRRSIELGLTLREANAVSPEELQELLEGEGTQGTQGTPSEGPEGTAQKLKRELQEKERLLEEARKEIEREKAQRAAEAHHVASTRDKPIPRFQSLISVGSMTHLSFVLRWRNDKRPKPTRKPRFGKGWVP